MSTKEGLVVYGSLIGASVAFLLFCRRYQLPALPLGDLVAPSLALGLALGRLGCLLNGCCFGGPCEHAWAVTFPADSPPYLDQKGWGDYHGFRLAEGPSGEPLVGRIDPEGPFAATSLRVGDLIVAIGGTSGRSPRDGPIRAGAGRFGVGIDVGRRPHGQRLGWPFARA